MLSKTLHNLHIYFDAAYKNKTFHACASIVRLQVLICYVNTCLQSLIKRFLLKSPSLSVVSDPRNVLRHKQGRLTM